jgi:transcription elongation factor Elf1
MATSPVRTHTCPVCGHTGPCIYAALDATGQFRFHNCHVCGSTWKEHAHNNEHVKESQAAVPA